MEKTNKVLLINKPYDVKITEIPLRDLEYDEVLIRVHAAAICINDVRDYKGEVDVSYPRIGGHEFAGEIVDMGRGVNKNRFKIGQKVIPYIIDNCGECYHCKHGYENICPDFKSTTTYKNPEGISGFLGFSKYYIAKASDVYICGDHVPYEHLAVVEPIACTLNSINLCDLQYGDDVLVIGAGPMGLLHVLLAKLKGVRVIVSEPKADRRENALKHGAAYAIDPSRQNLVTEVMKITDGLGVKTVFCATPNPEPSNDAIACCTTSGTVVMFSSLHPNTPVEVNLGHIHSTQKNIIGALNGSYKTFWQAIQLLNKGIFNPTPVIEAIYDYHEFDEAMACAMRDDTYKVVMRITD